MVYKGLECMEAGRVSDSDYVYVKAIVKGNTLRKFDRNGKWLSGWYKKLYDKKCIILVLKLYKGGI